QSTDILIGNNFFWKFILPQQITQLPSGLFLIPSKLGLLMGGEQVSNQQKSQSSVSNSFVLIAHTLVNQAVPAITQHEMASQCLKMTQSPSMEDWWSLESIGVKDNPEENDDDVALEQFNSKIRISDGRFEVRFPWKTQNPKLPDNYGLALGRFHSQAKKYQEDTELLSKSDAIIQDQITKNVIEVVDPGTSPARILHYLPHHAVVTPQKHTTKVRLVFDTSSKANQQLNSLNDCLYRGPVILPSLVGVLFRFRFYPYVMTADIEKAFLQVNIRDEDKDSTRFLWFRDGTNPEVNNNLMICRFNRVPFGLNCSPFLLAASVKYLLQTATSKVAIKLQQNMYVDNAMMGVNAIEEAHGMYQESKKLFTSAKFNLREYNSNNQEFIKMIPEEDRAKDEQPAKYGFESLKV
ncbi:MAG: hypothetical protein GY696_09320, partial [Gammaproteobacteria bacterium]|nr:hypothetical protein [Gammaproteobacteria bacterium]